ELEDPRGPLRQQAWTGATHPNRPAKVDIHDAEEPLRLEPETAGEDHAGRVAQPVQSLEPRHEPIDGGLIRDVEEMGCEAAGRVATGLDLGLGQPRDGDLRTLDRERVGDRPSDPAGAARDQDPSARKGPVHPHPAPPSTIAEDAGYDRRISRPTLSPTLHPGTGGSTMTLVLAHAIRRLTTLAAPVLALLIGPGLASGVLAQEAPSGIAASRADLL